MKEQIYDLKKVYEIVDYREIYDFIENLDDEILKLKVKNAIEFFLKNQNILNTTPKELEYHDYNSEGAIKEVILTWKVNYSSGEKFCHNEIKIAFDNIDNPYSSNNCVCVEQNIKALNIHYNNIEEFFKVK